MQLISLTEEYKDLLLQIPLFDNIPLSNRHDFVENLDFNVYEIEKMMLLPDRIPFADS